MDSLDIKKMYKNWVSLFCVASRNQDPSWLRMLLGLSFFFHAIGVLLLH